MSERFGSAEYKELLVCALTAAEWVCPFKFENLPLSLPSRSHFSQQDRSPHDSALQSGPEMEPEGARGGLEVNDEGLTTRHA